MIARVTWGKLKPGKWEEFQQLWNEYNEGAGQARGLRGRILLRDDSTEDAGYSISFWDTEADFAAYDGSRMTPPELVECFLGEYVTTVTRVCGTNVAGLAD